MNSGSTPSVWDLLTRESKGEIIESISIAFDDEQPKMVNQDEAMSLLGRVLVYTDVGQVSADGANWLGNPFVEDRVCTFLAWTPSFVIFPLIYDGMLRVRSVPRHPAPTGKVIEASHEQ